MKNKISFTSVLKSKSQSRHMNSSNTESQNRQPRLVDIYQEFETNPDKNYTLDLNAFRVMAYRSRNSSISMVRSNYAQQDPEMSLDNWIQRQKKQNFESYSKPGSQKSFRSTLAPQQESIQNNKRKPSFTGNQITSQEYEMSDQIDRYGGEGYLRESSQVEMESSNRFNRKLCQKPTLHYRQQKNLITQQNIPRPKPQIQEPQQPPQPEQYFGAERLQPPSYFPHLQQDEYRELEEEFQKLKKQKIAEICMQTKKSIKKEKLEQIISKALENVYADIQQMAQKIVSQRKKLIKNKSTQEEVSEEMLISGCQEEIRNLGAQNQSIDQTDGEQRRKEEMKNMIKGYITGINEAKSQGKSSVTYFASSKGYEAQQRTVDQKWGSKQMDKVEEDQEPSFNYHNNRFTQLNENKQKEEEQSLVKEGWQGQKNVANFNVGMDSVGYSFANSNMVCDHSFNNELAHNQFHKHFGQHNQFQFDSAQPPVYQPQSDDCREEQRISLPNIEEVKSDCGDLPQEAFELQSSEAIQFKRNNIINQPLEIKAHNIKNIESIHYQPPTRVQTQPQLYNQNKQLFRNFHQPSSAWKQHHQIEVQEKREVKSSPKDEVEKEQNINSHQENRFVSKTFNSYLSGQMRQDYGQAVKELSKEATGSSFGSKRSGFGYKIEPIAKYSPEINKQGTEKLGMDQSSQLSLNQSSKDVALRQQGLSPKNVHQLESKSKFSINSPMNKIDQIMRSEQQFGRQDKVTDFSHSVQKSDLQQPTGVLVSSKSYAISYSTNPQPEPTSAKLQSESPRNSGVSRQYACASSIVSNSGLERMKDQKLTEAKLNQNNQDVQSTSQPLHDQQKNLNPILSMQPLKLSLQTSMRQPAAQPGSNPITQSNTRLAQTYKNNTKLLESHQQNRPLFKECIPKIDQKGVKMEKISSGRAFLQSLHEKQSIEIELSPQNKSGVPDLKESFVAQTFRPAENNNVKSSVKVVDSPVNGSNLMGSVNKLPVTKITLRSSDKSQIASPKVISLSINHIAKKQQALKEVQLENRENVFQSLTIKQSKKPQNSTSKMMMPQQHNNILTNKAQTANIYLASDTSSKQNNNTLNSSSVNFGPKLELTKNVQTKPADTMKQSVKSSSHMPTQKKEPLLKLSKNLGQPIQQSGNMKKSIGESIRNKLHSGPSLMGSKFISIGGYGARQSIKGVKQSIGNDSDMEFDLQLD